MALQSTPQNRRGFLLLLALHGLLFLLPAFVKADGTGDRRRAQLANVRRIIVMPPFFGTEILSKAEADAKAENARPNEKLQKYAELLRKVESHAKTQLPERIRARTGFQVVPAEEVTEALKELKLTPEQMYQNGGRLRGTKFPPPDPQAIRRLATNLHADAVLLGVMDEPRRSTGKYYYDFLTGINYSPANTRGKAAYSIFLADGTEILTHPVEALHPLSRIGDREYLLADWSETEDLVIENFLDELTRYTPRK